MNPPSSSAADKVADVLEDEVAGSVEVLEAAAAEVHRGLQTAVHGHGGLLLLHEADAGVEVGDGGDARRPPGAEEGGGGDAVSHLGLREDVSQADPLKRGFFDPFKSINESLQSFPFHHT